MFGRISSREDLGEEMESTPAYLQPFHPSDVRFAATLQKAGDAILPGAADVTPGLDSAA
jgi:hypothetical protein